jgi:transcriptional regulator with GAF, ATPase, and Fis domain
MIALLKTVAQVADSEVTVLIQGESGTGKELVARALHCNSRRCDHPFVPVNCAALPESLLESELFGHVRGAFTGAIKDKAGWFERAHGGTIFLDEVNEMTLPLQVKLLRVLQEGEYSRVGSTDLRRSDARVLAASSNDLKRLMEQGRFREELYYRLNVVDVWVPPLRERKCDIPLLARHFLKLYGDKFSKRDLRLAPETETILLAYDFPGNVRELENVIQRAVVLAEDDVIAPPLLPPALFHLRQSQEEKSSSFKIAKAQALQKFEREYLTECLLAAQGCITHAAHIAGMDLKNFYAKMKRLGIDPHAFKTMAEK